MAEIRHLRYFLAVAKQLNFSRAALDLTISQAALSEAVRKLETELGTQLFERTNHGLRLTGAGTALRDEAGAAVDAFERALASARAAGRGEAGRLRVGFVAAGAGRLSTLARARFAARHPGVAIEPKRFGWGGEVQGLREGACEVAFVWLPADETGLEFELVTSEPRYAGLAADHRLANRAALSIAELNPEPLMWTRRAPRFWVDWWAVNPRPDGTEPVWGPENDNVEEMLEQVAQGSGVCIVPESMTSYYARPDLVWVPITDIDPLRIALGWRAGERSPLVAAFVEIVRELAHEADGR